MDAFGELRSLLQQPPSAELYEQLCARFERIKPEDALERCLPYARARLDHTWPSQLRTWNKSWTRRFVRGQILPVTGLATSCDLSNRRLGAEHISALQNHDYLRELEHLSFYRNEALGLCLKALAQLPMLYGVKHLNIGRIGQFEPGPLQDLLNHPSLFALETLACANSSAHPLIQGLGESDAGARIKRLSCNSGYAHASLITLLKAPLPALEALTVDICEGPSPQLIEAISDSSWWPQLKELHLLYETQLETIRLIWPLRPKGLKRLSIREPMTYVGHNGVLATAQGLEELDELITWPWLKPELNAALLERLNPNARALLLAHWRAHHAYAKRLFE